MDQLGLGPQQPIIGGQPGSGLAYPVPLSGLMMGPQGAGMGMEDTSGASRQVAPAQAQQEPSIDPLLLQAILAQSQIGEGGIPGLGNISLTNPFGATLGQGGGGLGQDFLTAGAMQPQPQPSGGSPGTGFQGDNTLKALGAISQLVKLASPFLGTGTEGQGEQPQGQRGGTAESPSLADQLRSAATPGGIAGAVGEIPLASSGGTLGQGGGAAGGGTLGQFGSQTAAPTDALAGFSPIGNISLEQRLGEGGGPTPSQLSAIQQLVGAGLSQFDAASLIFGKGFAGDPEAGLAGGQDTPTSLSGTVPGGVLGGTGASQGGLSLQGGIQGLSGGLGLTQGIMGLLRAIQSGNPAAEAKAASGVLSQATGLANTANSLSGNAAGLTQGATQGLSGISGGLGTAASLAGLVQDIQAGNYPAVTKDALSLLKSIYSLYSGISGAAGAGAGAAGATAGATAGAGAAGAADAALGGTTAGSAAGAGTGSIAGSALGSALGTYGGVSAVYDLAKLGFQLGLGGGEGPSSGNPYMDAVMGLLGPVGDVIGLFSRGAFTPSESWITFPQRLQETLRMENQELGGLFTALNNARTQGDVSQDAQLFANAIAQRVGGYGLQPGTGAPQLAPIPGATGGTHEGRAAISFDPQVSGLNQLMGALYPLLPAGAAAPLSQSAFNWGATQNQWDQVNNLTNQYIAGGGTAMPDTSNLSPVVRNLLARNIQSFQDTQRQQALYEQMLAGAQPTGA